MTTLSDLRVGTLRGWYEDKWYEYRRATVQDLVDALRELGALEKSTVTDHNGVHRMYLKDTDEPGSYLVFRIESDQ